MSSANAADCCRPLPNPAIPVTGSFQGLSAAAKHRGNHHRPQRRHRARRLVAPEMRERLMSQGAEPRPMPVAQFTDSGGRRPAGAAWRKRRGSRSTEQANPRQSAGVAFCGVVRCPGSRVFSGRSANSQGMRNAIGA